MNEKRTILVGGGGHASSILESFGNSIAGYLSKAPNPSLDLPRLGDDNDAKKFKDRNDFHIAFVFSGIPNMQRRKELIDKYKELNVEFHTFISPMAMITPGSLISPGAAILTGAIINKGVIGENSIINSGAIIEHDTVIGDNVFVGPGAIIGGLVKIEDNVFIGLGAKIRNGIKIVSGVTIGMGSIVTKDILNPGIYYGVI